MESRGAFMLGVSVVPWLATMRLVAAPRSEPELFARAESLAGRTLREVADAASVEVPPDLRRMKGWVGQLVERVLGATAASRAAPDFESLGVELKTLPVGQDHVPVESTFVCTIDLVRIGDTEWEGSLVRRKLSRVLFVPVEGDRAIPLASRRIGTPLLWSPTDDEEAALRFDWEELAGLIGRGDVEAITGHLGQHLQVRPKAANARSLRRGLDVDGSSFATLPRGFYLRTSFTARLLRDRFSSAG
jgi:DNA mismatch repair protein MutH